MNITVLLKMVPDVVEELRIAVDKKSLDKEWLRMKLSESDEHALEEAILLKEKYGGKVSVVAIDAPELDDVLYNALAKGADKSVKIITELKGICSASIAQIFSVYIKDHGDPLDSQSLILTGSQAIDDLDGETSYYLSEYLGLNSTGVVTNIRIENNKAVLIKEFAGGLRGEYEASLPLVVGVQAAEKPPRYIPIAKVRAIMKSAKIEEIEITEEQTESLINLVAFSEPEVGGKAKILEGDPEKISSVLTDIIIEHGIISGGLK